MQEARRILKSGQSVVIDRCHIDARQRADFLALARELNVPVSLHPGTYLHSS